MARLNTQNEPPIHTAARCGDHALLEERIRAGDDPNLIFDQRTPLMTATASRDGATGETIRLLLSLGADPAMIVAGRSAMTWAAREWWDPPAGDPERLRALLEARVPLIVEEESAERFVAHVAARGDVALLRLLLDAGASANPVWDREAALESSFRLALDVGCSVEELLRHASAPWSHEIPLFEAVEADSIECVRLLLDRGADPLIRDNSRQSALYLARSEPMVRLLHEHGLSTTDADHLGWSPLVDAVHDGEHGLTRVRALVAVGADVNETHDHGFTVFMSAAGAHERSVEMLQLLVDLGADPHAVSEYGWNAFHAAVDTSGDDDWESRVRSVLGYLRALGVNIEHRNLDGETPLGHAIEKGRPEEVRALCEIGADPNAPTRMTAIARFGNRGVDLPPLLLTIRSAVGDWEECVQPLLRAGADPLAEDEAGFTTLQYAVSELCSGDNRKALYKAFFENLETLTIPENAAGVREAYVDAIRPAIRAFVESFSESNPVPEKQGRLHRPKKERQMRITAITELIAYERWAELAK